MLANVALVLALVPALPQAQDWPHFRGPHHSGWIEAGEPWSATGKAEPLWTANVGKGYSCPSIAGEHLVTLGHDAEAGVDRVTCLDRTTGKPRWSFTFAATDKPEYHGGGTLSTPTIAAGRVYCINRDGKFHALQLDSGEVLWRRDYQKELAVERTFHGFSASPLVAGDRIYLQLGGLVAAVSAKDGEVLWRTKDEGDASHANLLPIEVRGEPALATVVGELFVVLRARDGELLHEYPWRISGNAMHCSMPVAIGDNRFFVSTAYNKGCAMLQIGDAKQPTSIWSNRRMRNKVTACVSHQGNVYGFDESMLRCLDLDGNSKWRVRGLGLGSLSIVGDRLLVLTSDGELIIAEASPAEFRELSRNKVLDGGVYWTTPVFVGGLIYVRNSLGDLCCLDHRTGPTSAAGGIDATTLAAPPATKLFASHAELVGGRSAFAQRDKALQLRGTWSVPLRGLKDGKMTWTLAPSNRWDQRLDDEFLYTFDGKQAWAVEPQGPRLIVGAELFEHRYLFGLPDLFAPACPGSAQVAKKPVRFAETACWQVTSQIPAGDGESARTVKHYFTVATGRLVGREGPKQSTLVLHGSQQLGGLTLPARITRYRAEDGQEHILTLQAAEWITTPAKLFQQPPPILRLLRSPADLARDTAALKQRFAGALARYKPKETDTPLEDDIVTLRVHHGELWFATPEPEFRIAVEAEKDGVFGVDGPPIRFSFVNDKTGRTTALKMMMPGERTILLHRLPN
tara:strand:- start:144624 stop:146843 length:2220 start_codon:yes stop_codon:yes gene_type:complete